MHQILQYVVFYFMPLEVIYQRRQVEKPFCLSYRQASVNLFCACASEKLGICNHVRRPVSRDRRILVMEMAVGKAAYLAYSIFAANILTQFLYSK